MDPSQLPTNAIFAALKWPHRIADLRTMFGDFPSLTPMDGLMWDSISRCEAAGVPSDPADFHERFLHDIRSNYPDYHQRMVDYVTALRTRSDLTEQYLFEALKNHAMQSICGDMSLLSDPDDIAERVARITMIRSIGTASVTSGVDLFANRGRDVMVPLIRHPMDECCIVQDLFDGLPPRGTLTLFVMPQKGGKTTLSMNLAKAGVNAGMRVLYLNFEQNVQGDLANRVFTSMSGVELDVFKVRGSLDDCPQYAQDLVDARMDLWRSNFAMLGASELSQPGLFANGIDGLRSIMDDACMRQLGGPPDIVIFDWWTMFWNIAKVSMQGVGRMDTQSMRGMEALQFLQFKLMMADYNATGVVFQQLAFAKAGNARNIDQLSANDAAENKGLPAFADASVVSTLVFNDHSVIFKKVLDRNQAAGHTGRFTLDGAHQRFERYNSLESQSEAEGGDLPGGMSDAAAMAAASGQRSVT